MANKIIIILLLFSFISKTAYLQEMRSIDSLINKGNYKQAINYLDIYLDSVERKDGRLNETFAKAYSQRNYLLNMTGDNRLIVKNRYDTLLGIRKSINGKSSLEVADVLMDLSIMNSLLNNSDDAEKLLLKSLKIKQHLLGDTDTKVIESKINYAVMLLNRNKNTEGLKILLELNDTSKYNLPIYLKLFVFENLAKAYKGLNNAEKQEAILLEAYRYLEIIIDFGELPDVSHTIRIFNALGEIYNSKNQFEKADSINVPAFELSNNLGLNSDLYQSSLSNLVSTYLGLEKFKDAKELLLGYFYNAKPKSQKDTVYLINNLKKLGQLYSNLEDVDSSKYYFSKAEKFSFLVLKGNEKEGLQCLSGIYFEYGNALYDNNIFDASALYFKKALEIQKQISVNLDTLTLYYSHLIATYSSAGEFDSLSQVVKDELTGKALSKFSADKQDIINESISLAYYGMGSFLYKQKLYDSSINILLNKSLDYLNRVKKKWNKNLEGNIYFALAQNYYKLAERVKAIKYFTLAVDILKNVLTKEEYLDALMKAGNSSFGEFKLYFYNKAQDFLNFTVIPPYSRIECFNDLSLFYIDIGDFEKAKRLLGRASFLSDSIFNADSSFEDIKINHLRGVLASNYGRVFRQFKEYEQSLDQYRKALVFKAVSDGVNSFSYASTLDKIGVLYNSLKQEDSSFFYKKEALIIRENLDSNRTNEDLAESYLNIGAYYDEEKNQDSAQKYLLLSLEIFQKKKSPELILSLINLCNLSYNMGDSVAYAHYLANFLNDFIEQQDRAKTVLSFEQYHSVNHQLQFVFDMNASHIADSYVGNEQINQNFCNYILWNTLNELRNIKSDLTDHNEQYVTWQNIKNEISHLEFSNNTDYRKLGYLQFLRDSLEREINLKKTSNFTRETTWQKIVSSLSRNDLAIHFFTFPFYHNEKWTDSILTCAYIFTWEMQYPKLAIFFEQRQVDSLLISSNLKSYERQNTGLSKIFVDQLVDFLKQTNTIYISSSGLLNNINFSAIPVDSNITFGEKYSVHLVSSTADIINCRPTYLSSNTIKQSIVYGGIDYDRATTTPSNKAPEDNNIGYPQVAEIASRSAIAKFSYLPGTREEAKNVKQLCSNNGITAISFTGENATEVSFKQLNGKKEPFILHIATHGYFFPDPVQIKVNKSLQDFSDERKNVFKWSDDPLLRSGLIFAGANNTWGKTDYVSDTTEDGILTSYEISNLDLSNCQLVVLSACETGLGDIKGSEGVFGLQRAFKMAGVKNIIMSLWKVPDKETQELMTLFYNYCFSGKSVHDALQSAQTDMKKKYPPYYWAGFKLLE